MPAEVGTRLWSTQEEEIAMSLFPLLVVQKSRIDVPRYAIIHLQYITGRGCSRKAKERTALTSSMLVL